MYKRFYTTEMCPGRRMLEKRFGSIRRGCRAGKPARCMGLLLAVLLLAMGLLSAGVLADLTAGDGRVVINGRTYDLEPIHIDNTRYLYTDSWYVPMREVFEALNCTVTYDVDRAPLTARYGPEVHFPQYDWREPLVADDLTAQIYGATSRLNDMPVVSVRNENGETAYYQIASEWTPEGGWGPPPVLIDGRTYISIRSLVYFMVPEGEDADASIGWDGFAHDTFYDGRVQWDEQTRTLVIDAEASPGLQNYVDARARIYEDYGPSEQMIENRDYAFLILNPEHAAYATCMAVDKRSGEAAVLDQVLKELAGRLRLGFRDTAESTEQFELYIMDETGELAPYAAYDLKEYVFTAYR